VNDGVATIAGDVATQAQKTEATRLARITGISRVNNTIMVDKDVNATLAERAKAGLTKKGEHLSDPWIAAKVRWFLDRERLLTGSDIKVQSSDHVVTLSGIVPSSAAQVRAVQLAKGIEGVVRVVDQLMIR
jgi:hyperosmotically inducible protein